MKNSLERIAEKNRLKRKTQTKEGLINYCEEKNRVCPVPLKWMEVMNIIKVTPGEPGSLTSLVLGGWDSTHEEKRDRLKKQIEYASENQDIFQNLQRFILRLKDEDWYCANPNFKL